MKITKEMIDAIIPSFDKAAALADGYIALQDEELNELATEAINKLMPIIEKKRNSRP